jgi:ligand-binding sensor domain-containing protein
MIVIASKILLAICLPVFLVSWNEQQEAETQRTTDHESVVGREASALDDRIGAIYQDAAGQYWFGSNGTGLYGFDGATLRQFATEDGLPSDQIRGLQADRTRTIWLGTANNGAYRYAGENFEKFEPR